MIYTTQDALRQAIKKEHLSKKEAEQIILSLDKRIFLEQLVNKLKYKHLMAESEIQALFHQNSSSKIGQNLPVSIFTTPELSALEVICRYLKDEKGLRYSEIALLLNRDQRTIWVTYHNSLKKRGARLELSPAKYEIPLTIFQDRSHSVLESIVHHLKDTYNLRYSEIAVLINRDERNIWQLYNRQGGRQNA